MGERLKRNTLNRELGAAGGAAARQNQATLMGAHAGTKTMNAGTFVFFGLESSLWHGGIITMERAFVTEGYISAILAVVDKMGIIK